GEGPATLLLLYPIAKNSSAVPETEPLPLTSELESRWAERAVVLDLNKAPAVDKARPETRRWQVPAWPLDRAWARALAWRLAVLEALAPDFSFYSLAHVAVGRRFQVSAPSLVQAFKLAPDIDQRHLYDLVAGGAALQESLAKRRLLQPS